MNRLENKIAIVTGGAGGIGSATVRRLVSEGARVVVADLNMEAARALAGELGGKAKAVEFDAADTESIRSLIDGTAKEFGRLDVLHNNHAATDTATHVADTTVVEGELAVWRRTMEVNLLSFMSACKFAIPHMLAGGGGSIINTSSDAGLAGDIRNTAYGVSKAGVMSLTQHVAAQYGRQGVRCNSIAPGMIMTEALKRVNPTYIGIVERQALTPRAGVPEDIAALVAYLAADESGFVNGQIISCDGGHLAHQPQIMDVIDYEAKLSAQR